MRMVYLPTFTNKNQPNVGKYTNNIYQSQIGRNCKKKFGRTPKGESCLTTTGIFQGRWLLVSGRVYIPWKSFCWQLFIWFFRKDYCFSKGLLSTFPGKWHFYGLWLPGYMYIYLDLPNILQISAFKGVGFFGWILGEILHTISEDPGIEFQERGWSGFREDILEQIGAKKGATSWEFWNLTLSMGFSGNPLNKRTNSQK